MSSFKGDDLRHALKKKGFVEDPISDRGGRKHEFFYLFYNGKKTSVRTHLSHGNKEYGDVLITNFKKQMRLSKKEFFAFIGCELDEKKYTELLIERNEINP